MAYLSGYSDGSARLFFALHHLIVDTVSWRILIDDVRRLLSSESLGEKTSSYRQWVKTVSQYSDAHPEEAEYWEAQFSDLPDYAAFDCGKATTKILALAPSRTQALLKECSGAYHTEINDLLLTALGCALKIVWILKCRSLRWKGMAVNPSIRRLT